MEKAAEMNPLALSEMTQLSLRPAARGRTACRWCKIGDVEVGLPAALHRGLRFGEFPVKVLFLPQQG